MKKDEDILEFIEKGKESLKAAEILIKENFYDFSASRAYYAMFYSTIAVLLTKDLSFSKHSATISFFGKEFIKSKIFPIKMHKNLVSAFDLRQMGDYGAPGSIKKEKAVSLLEDAKEFVETIEKYLNEKGYITQNLDKEV